MRPDPWLPLASHFSAPVLTAYLDINPANPRNQRTPRGYVTWLTATGRAVSRRLPPKARDAFRAELARVERYLRMEPPRGRGLVIFSGPTVWEVIPLQVEVAEEIHWGRPSLQHMLWFLDEHRPRGVVVVDGSGARFFGSFLGQVAEDEAAAFSPNTSTWRQKHLVGPSHPGVSKRHGTQRDRVRDRMAAQHDRFARELAQRVAAWADEKAISPVLLVGTNDMVGATFNALPPAMRKRTAIIRKALPAINAPQVKAALTPALIRWERQYEEALVDQLVDAQSSSESVLGLDETMGRLQDGHVRELVVARGFAGTARQCTQCGWADASADTFCVGCGGERQARTLRTLVPELASLYAVPVEVVAGRAARTLEQSGGIGAWLRSAEMPMRRSERRTQATARRVRSDGGSAATMSGRVGGLPDDPPNSGAQTAADPWPAG